MPQAARTGQAQGDGRRNGRTTMGDVLVASVIGFLSMFLGAWGLSKLRVSVGAKTAIAIGSGLVGGLAVGYLSKPVGLGLAAGLGGLGITSAVAQAAGATDSDRLFGFSDMAETRAVLSGRSLLPERRVGEVVDIRSRMFGPQALNRR